MLGRGTRRCDEINKDHFTIFDCFDGTLIQYFAQTNDFKIEPPTKEPTPLPQVVENIWQNVDREYHVNLLVKRLRRIEKNMSGKAREEFAQFIPDGDVSRFADQLPQLIRKEFTPTLGLLRRSEFQELLQNYERAKNYFLVAIEAEDTVTSRAVSRFGKFEKPEDYLDAFSKFVKTNADQITALSILLQRPRHWKTEALTELQQKLKENQYDEKQLREAHRVVYHKALADIISMVKHAAKEDEPILTAAERVARAVQQLMAGRTFTEEQQRWLTLIQEHLTQHLTISEEDFDLMPIFTNRGGIGKVRKLFGDQLPALIEELNYAIAA
jgi:type I restriction enzyme R subunit